MYIVQYSEEDKKKTDRVEGFVRAWVGIRDGGWKQRVEEQWGVGGGAWP